MKIVHVDCERSRCCPVVGWKFFVEEGETLKAAETGRVELAMLGCSASAVPGQIQMHRIEPWPSKFYLLQKGAFRPDLGEADHPSFQFQQSRVRPKSWFQTPCRMKGVSLVLYPDQVLESSVVQGRERKQAKNCLHQTHCQTPHLHQVKRRWKSEQGGMG